MANCDPNHHLQQYFKVQQSDLGTVEDLIAENLSEFFSFLQNQTTIFQNERSRCCELFSDNGLLKRIRRYEKLPPASLSVCRDISSNPLLLTLAESGGFDEKAVDTLAYLVNKLDENLRANRFEFVSFIEDQYFEESCQYWAVEDDEDLQFVPSPTTNLSSSNKEATLDVSSRTSSPICGSRSVSTGSRDATSLAGSDDAVSNEDLSDPINLLLDSWTEVMSYCDALLGEAAHDVRKRLPVVKYLKEPDTMNASHSKMKGDLYSVLFSQRSTQGDVICTSSDTSSLFPTYRPMDEVDDEVALAASFARKGFQPNTDLPLITSWSELFSQPFSHNYDAIAEQWFAEQSNRLSQREKKRKRSSDMSNNSNHNSDNNPNHNSSNSKRVKSHHHLNVFESFAEFPIPVTSHHPAAWKIGHRPSLEDLLASSEKNQRKNLFETIHPAFLSVNCTSPPSPNNPNNPNNPANPADFLNSSSCTHPKLFQASESANESHGKVRVGESSNPLHLLQLALERLEHHLERFATRNIARLTKLHHRCSQEILTSLALSSYSSSYCNQNSAVPSMVPIIKRLQDCCLRLFRYNEPKSSGRVVYPKQARQRTPQATSCSSASSTTCEARGKLDENPLSENASHHAPSSLRRSTTALSLQQTLSLPLSSSSPSTFTTTCSSDTSGSKVSHRVSFSVDHVGNNCISPQKRRSPDMNLGTTVSTAPCIPSNITDFIGGVCDARHFPEGYDSFIARLKVGDVLSVRLKNKGKDKDRDSRRSSNVSVARRKGVVLQLRRDVERIRYVKVKFLSSDAAPSSNDKEKEGSAGRYYKGSSQSRTVKQNTSASAAPEVAWIAVEDCCFEPVSSLNNCTAGRVEGSVASSSSSSLQRSEEDSKSLGSIDPSKKKDGRVTISEQATPWEVQRSRLANGATIPTAFVASMSSKSSSNNNHSLITPGMSVAPGAPIPFPLHQPSSSSSSSQFQTAFPQRQFLNSLAMTNATTVTIPYSYQHYSNNQNQPTLAVQPNPHLNHRTLPLPLSQHPHPGNHLPTPVITSTSQVYISQRLLGATVAGQAPNGVPLLNGFLAPGNYYPHRDRMPAMSSAMLTPSPSHSQYLSRTESRDNQASLPAQTQSNVESQKTSHTTNASYPLYIQRPPTLSAQYQSQLVTNQQHFGLSTYQSKHFLFNPNLPHPASALSLPVPNPQYYTLPSAAPTSQPDTFRLLPGGQLRKNNSTR